MFKVFPTDALDLLNGLAYVLSTIPFAMNRTKHSLNATPYPSVVFCYSGKLVFENMIMLILEEEKN